MVVKRQAAVDALAAQYRRLPAGMRQRIARARLHAREEVWTRVHEFRVRHALLSVVMPVYNVEGYLEEAVQSVLTQSHRNLELILVDDGSTDTSGDLCDAFARQDPRVRVIHKRNAGLGAARNTGIEAARGSYLIFIDSDDYVLPGAYESMLRSLVTSGSEVVTGNVQRKQGQRIYQAWNQSRSHREDRQGTTLAALPDLLFDTVAWNKMFRRDFWNEQVKTFPEGKLYEDMLPVFKSLASAKSIDVLSRTIYTWRFRDEGNSITQRLLEMKNIDDRFEMVDAIDAMIRDRGMPDSLRDLLRDKVLEGDVWVYVREIRGASPEVIERIQEAVRHYWGSSAAKTKARAEPERRVCYWLLEHGRAADVVPFREWYATVRQALPINDLDGRLFLDPTNSPVSLDGIPAEYLDIDILATVVSNVMSLEWTSPTVLTARGYAYIRFITHGEQRIQLIARNNAGAEPVTFDVERTESPAAARWAWDTADDHEHDGYVCHIDMEKLRNAGGLARGRGEWTFHVRISEGDVERTSALSRIWRSGSAGIVPASVLSDGTVAMARTTDGRPLRVLFDRNGVFAESAEVVRATARIRFPASAAHSAVWATESRARREVRGVRGGDGTMEFQLPAPLDGEMSTFWTFNADVNGRRIPVFAPAGFAMEQAADRPQGMRATADRSGRLAVRCDLNAVFVADLEIADDGTLELRGAVSALDALEVSLDATPEIWHPASITADGFSARLPITYTADGATVPFREGTYVIRGRRPIGVVGEPQKVTVYGASDLVRGFPSTHLRDLASLRLSRADRDAVAVAIAAPVPEVDLGRLAKERLISRFVAGERRALEEAVFFCTDLGSTVGDSALAICKELYRRDSPLVMYWGVTDHSVVVPDGVVPIVKHSKDWYDKINSSRYIVNNYGGLWGLRKGAGQRYLQTWHGTPYKYIGAAEARHQNEPESRVRVIAAEAGEWDAVVSPSPYMSDIIARDLLFAGTVLESGYPRNDVLATATAAETAATRRSLGLPQDAKVLLYAPTFRENQRHGTKADLFDALDLDRLIDLLGPDWYVVLRGHGFNARNDQVDRSHGRLVDATHHRSINDLYLSADAMVTDYSSTMFDYAVTGRPMAFFTPDLKQYIAARGVYLDLVEIAPGPLHSDVRHLADALRDLDALAAQYAEKYKAFRERFTPWDDGKAAARVVDAFFR